MLTEKKELNQKHPIMATFGWLYGTYYLHSNCTQNVKATVHVIYRAVSSIINMKQLANRHGASPRYNWRALNGTLCTG